MVMVEKKKEGKIEFVEIIRLIPDLEMKSFMKAMAGKTQKKINKIFQMN